MLKTRIIPCLLLKDKGLVKGRQFKDHYYVGDPINAVRIFSEKEASELVFLDITATFEKRTLDIVFITKIAEESCMPFTVGGGIKTIKDVKKILNAGSEKVSINTQAVDNPTFIKEIADTFGHQSIVVSIDVKKNKHGAYEVYTRSGTKPTGLDPVEWALKVESLGAGEILLGSIDLDGTMCGYDILLIKKVSAKVRIPVIACGGAGKLEDFGKAIKLGGCSAVAAGSYFVFYGKKRAVLINYPSDEEIREVIQ